MNVPVVIVGGGISGLTTAYGLRKAGVDVVVLEKDGRVGGTMQTEHVDGWLIERGPNSALETTPLLGEICDGVGITHLREYANPAGKRRYVLRDGRLLPIPMSPLAFITSRLWTTRGKLRLLREPFVGRAEWEESIADFVVRRLGREMLDYAINPFVAGVYAGNPEQLSVRMAFPKLFALEEKYGGLIRGMVLGARDRKRRAEKAKDRAKMFSFKGGMETFPEGIASWLGQAVRTGTQVTSIAPVTPHESGARFSLEVATPSGKSAIKASAVVLATPASSAAALLSPILPDLASTLMSLHYPPVAVVYFGFTGDQLTRPLDGFGYLIPAVEKRKILGTIWSSALFGGRAPEGHVALTTFVGGSRQPEVLDCSDEKLGSMALGELHDIMGIRGEPVFIRIIRWEKAIPQYIMGYRSVIDQIERAERSQPGLFVCSNYRGGIAVGDCVMNGHATAAKVAAFVQA